MRHHARAAGEVGFERHARVGEFALYNLAGAVLFVAQFRMRMKIASNFDQVWEFFCYQRTQLIADGRALRRRSDCGHVKMVADARNVRGAWMN